MRTYTNSKNNVKQEFLACRAEGDARARLEQAARRQGRSMSGVLRWLIDSLPAVQDSQPINGSNHAHTTTNATQ